MILRKGMEVTCCLTMAIAGAIHIKQKISKIKVFNSFKMTLLYASLTLKPKYLNLLRRIAHKKFS